VLSDLFTVMWKERKGLFRQRGSRARAAFTLLVPALMVGVLLPLQIGADWVNGYWSVIASLIIPLLVVGTTIPESFAGERERHTLATLLASRLSGRVILFGKVAASVAYAWVLMLIVLLISLVTVNITHWNGHILLFTPTAGLFTVVLGLLMAGCMAGFGVLISLRSATVQGATQALMAITLSPLILLQIAGFLVLEVRREWLDAVIEALGRVNVTQLVPIVCGVFAVICGGLMWAAMARFRRSRLILL